MKKKILDNIQTLFYALIIALLIRSFLFQPFYIPSSSMEPSLLIGDRLFVSKYTYGYSRHSFPFSPTNYNKRFLPKKPKRGDVIVFKTPADDRTDYIKRLIGLPGETIQFVTGNIFLNDVAIERKKIELSSTINCWSEIFNVNFYEEIIDDVKYVAVYKKNGTLLNTDKFIVPNEHYFFLGDNRDCSKDSRYLNSVGYVSFNNLVGKARVIFFSNDIKKGYFIKFWKWHESIRVNRFFKRIIWCIKI